MKTLILSNNVFLIIVSTLLLGLSQLHLGFGFIAWFGLIPFIYVLCKSENLKVSIFYSIIWGFLYHLFTVFWLSQNIGTSKISAFISMLLAVVVLTVNTILIVLIWYRINRKYKNIFIIPFIWASIEFLRSYGLLGFPWVSIANTQLDYFYLIQNAEYTGIYALSFWVVLINIFLYQIIFVSRSKKILLLFSSTFIFPWITGFLIYSNVDTTLIDNHKVSIIQPNINLLDKRDYSKRYKNIDYLIEKSKQCIIEGSNLIVWPESALPYSNLQNEKILDYIIKNLLIDNNSYLLTGNVIYDNDEHFNSAVLINKNGIQGVYNKRQLVPVAEQVPLSDFFPNLKNVNLGQANFSKGEKDILFNIDNNQFSSLICFESTFPDINRRHAKKGADYFIYLVNDGWYTGPPEPQQHFRQAIYRAIENRTTVVRCANTGISAVINPSGEISELIDLNKSGEITTFIEKSKRSTFYTNFGNVFAVIMLIITCAFLLETLYNGKKN